MANIPRRGVDGLTRAERLLARQNRPSNTDRIKRQVEEQTRRYRTMFSNDWVQHFREPGWTPRKRQVRSMKAIENRLMKHRLQGRSEVDLKPMSAWQDKYSGWIDFSGGRACALVIDNLVGNTAIVAYSRRGMVAENLWESHTTTNVDGTVTYDVQNCLNPGQNAHDMEEFCGYVKIRLQEHEPKLVNGGAAIVIPGADAGTDESETSGTAPGIYRYNEKLWPLQHTSGPLIGQNSGRQGYRLHIPDAIRRNVRQGTRLDITAEHFYGPATVDDLPTSQTDNPLGTFVAVFDPERSPSGYLRGSTRNEVTVWSDGDAVLPQPFVWS